jgi:hypothetical protein
MSEIRYVRASGNGRATGMARDFSTAFVYCSSFHSSVGCLQRSLRVTGLVLAFFMLLALTGASIGHGVTQYKQANMATLLGADSTLICAERL